MFKTKNKWLDIITILIVVSILVGIASAIETPPIIPTILSGSVKIGGQSAPVGTIISAKIDQTLLSTRNTQSIGSYGEKPETQLPIWADNDGTPIDLYVNNVKVKTIIYNSKDENLQINLDASGTSGGTSNKLSGGSGGGGGVSGAGITPTVTAKQQQPITTKESGVVTSTQGAAVETPAKKSGENPKFQFYSILGLFGLMMLGIIALKKMGKI